MKTGYYAALLDVVGAIDNWRIWGVFGWEDIRQRYRRSVLGPFWLTLSTAILIGTIGFVFANLFGQSLEEFFPNLAAGLIVWTFIRQVIESATGVFTSQERVIKQINLPLTTHVLRMIWQNLIILGHNAVILVVIWFWFGLWPGVAILQVVPGLVLLVLNGVWVVWLVAIICTRFRDVVPIISSVMQMLFYFTPILWLPAMMIDRGVGFIVDYNPMAHLLALVRMPLLGQVVPFASWAVGIGLLVVGTPLAWYAMGRLRHRIAFWL
ncbi:MAG: ABC transporter permease [Pseudomonadota bacterium]